MPSAKPKLSVVPSIIRIPEPDLRLMSVDLVGLSPLLCQRFSEKAGRQIAEGQSGAPKSKKRTPRDPHQEYLDSMHEHPSGGYAFPASAFRKAAISACRMLDGLPMTVARTLFICPQELVKIEGSKPVMDTRHVRLSSGSVDLRYRGIFHEWKTKLEIRYNAGATSVEQIANLLVLAGECIGVGELRPEKGGNYGRFSIAQTKATPRAK